MRVFPWMRTDTKFMSIMKQGWMNKSSETTINSEINYNTAKLVLPADFIVWVRQQFHSSLYWGGREDRIDRWFDFKLTFDCHDNRFQYEWMMWTMCGMLMSTRSNLINFKFTLLLLKFWTQLAVLWNIPYFIDTLKKLILCVCICKQ